MKSNKFLTGGLAWFALVVHSTAGDTLGTVCSEKNRVSNLESCMTKIKENLMDSSKFWFGTQYQELCPNGPDDDVICANPNPEKAESIGNRVFPENLDLDLITTFLNVTFTSEPGSYYGCGDTFKSTQVWQKTLDPTADDIVYPWFVRRLPEVTWDSGSNQMYTLVLYDAGYLQTLGIYINIQGNNVSSGEPLDAYAGPLIATALHNPYMFLLFRQNGRVTVPEDWIARIQAGTRTGGFTVPGFVTALNLLGPIAVNWMVATGDRYAAQTLLSRGFLNMCPYFVAKAIGNNERVFLPRNVTFDVSLDVSYNVSGMTYDVCCKTFDYESRMLMANPIGDPLFKTFDIRDAPFFNLTKAGYITNAKNFTGELHTLLIVDPDVPYPDVGTELLPLLHMSIINIVQGDVTSGQIVEPYLSPSPPGKPIHHYYFMLYRQEAELFDSDMRSYAGNACRSSFTGRCLYDINRLVSERNMALVGANWLKSTRDDYVIYREILKNPDDANVDIQCYGQPGYVKNCPVTSKGGRIDMCSFKIFTFVVSSVLIFDTKYK